MSETTVFRCDYCGTPEEEEPIGWARPHCSIAIVLRGRRFATVNGSVLPAAPPYPASPEDVQRWGNEQQWSMMLCDRCTKRIAALLDMPLETEEQFRARAQELLKREDEFRSAVRSSGGHLVTQFPTEKGPTVVPEIQGGASRIKSRSRRVRSSK
jgi:hypothetical protein